MEQILLNTLNPDANVRRPAEELLRTQETQPGLLSSVFSLYVSSMDFTVKFASLLLAKNVIQRQWHVAATNRKPAPIPLEEKEQIKKLIVNRLTMGNECVDKLREVLQLCCARISQHEFYDKWLELTEFLATASHGSFSLLDLVLKVQMKKMIPAKKKLYQEYAMNLYEKIKPLWAESQDFVLTKIMLRLLYAVKDSECLFYIMQKSQELLYTSGNEKQLKHILKGLNRIEGKFSDLFTKEILSLHIKTHTLIICELNPSTGEQSHLYRQCCSSLREIILTNPEVQLLLKQEMSVILNKIVCHPVWETKWQNWVEGDPSELLSETEHSDEHSLEKLLCCLLKVYPEYVDDFIGQLLEMPNLPFRQSHALTIFLGHLPKLQDPPGVSLKEILQVISILHQNRKERIIVLRDALWVIRKWVRIAEDYHYVYGIIQSIRSNCKDDFYLRYQSFLTLKELVNLRLPVEIYHYVLRDFSGDVILMMTQSKKPEIVWNLIGLVSVLLEKCGTEKSPELISSMQNSGFLNLLKTDDAMIASALCKMIEETIKVYNDELFAVELGVSFLNSQLGATNEVHLLSMWHSLVSNIEPNQQFIPLVDSLMINLLKLTEKDRSICIKIIEEYLFLYFSANASIEHILSEYCAILCSLKSNTEYDSLSLNLHVSISLVYPSFCLSYFNNYVYYLHIERKEIYDSISACNALNIINRLLLISPELISSLDIGGWFKSMVVLLTPIQKKTNCAAIFKVLPIIPPYYVQTLSETIYNFTVPYAENDRFQDSKAASPSESMKYKKTASSQLAPSIRKISLTNSLEQKLGNLHSLFTIAMAALRVNGIFFEQLLGEEKSHVVHSLLHETTPRPRSR